MNRLMPAAWIVRATGTKPALFLDYGLALAYSLRTGGALGALYEGQLPSNLPAVPAHQE